MKRVTRRIEFIEKPKDRALRFMNRRNGLVNKVHELSVLCGVEACMIINAPKGINNNDEPADLVWSSSSDPGVTVQELMKKYKEVSAEDRRKRVCNVSDYFGDKKRKAENMLASLKKENCEAKLLTWNSKFESLKEHELRDLANDLEIKIDNLKSRIELMKNKRVSRVINSNPSSQVAQLLRSNGGNDLQPVHMMEPSYMSPMTMMSSLHSNSSNNYQEIVRNRMKMPMNLIEDKSNYLQPVHMMQPSYMNPMAINSLHSNSNNNSQSIARNRIKMPMNSIEDKNNYDYQAMMNLLEDKNNNYVQPIAMVQPDVVNPVVLPMFDQLTLTDKRFVNYNSVARTEVNVSSSSSYLTNPAMMSTDLPRSSFYDHNVFNHVSVSNCMSMQHDYAYRNSQMEIRVSRQSFYNSSLPSMSPLPPSMLDCSTNGHVSSQMQYSEQLGTCSTNGHVSSQMQYSEQLGTLFNFH